jgi:hypothetical protein
MERFSLSNLRALPNNILKAFFSIPLQCGIDVNIFCHNIL